MGTVLAPVRRRILAGAFVAGLALALLAPTAAFAANTATFSSRVPAPGSWTTATRPTIAVTVYDRYGMRGAGAWSVTVDGVSVPVKATYLVRGSWNPSRPDYHRVRLSGRAPVALAPGKHKVTVKIRDIKQKSSTTSWTFTVKAPVTFSSPAPANGSSSQAARPVVSVSAYALYGAKGSGKFTMMIDGAPVTPAVTYTTNYTKFKISRPALTTDLSVGAHTVVVGVTDVKGNTRSYTWTFTTLDPPLLPMPGSAAVMEDCASCHPGYPAAHPMANCQGCHSKTAPPTRRPILRRTSPHARPILGATAVAGPSRTFSARTAPIATPAPTPGSRHSTRVHSSPPTCRRAPSAPASAAIPPPSLSSTTAARLEASSALRASHAQAVTRAPTLW
jgi:hypothetical protein